MAGTTRYKYETDEGNIFYAITDDSDGLADIRGEAPTAAHTEDATLEVSRSNKERGIKPRQALLQLIIEGSTQYNCIINTAKKYKKVVILTPNQVESIQFGGDSPTEVTVGDVTWTAVRLLEERVLRHPFF